MNEVEIAVNEVEIAVTLLGHRTLGTALSTAVDEAKKLPK